MRFNYFLVYTLYIIEFSISQKLLEDLQNYWTFDNHANDVIGGANLKNGVSVSFVPDRWGNINSAVYLNNGYYSAPAGVYFRGDHTVSVWVKVISVTNFARIIDFGNNVADNVILTISHGTTGRPASTVYSNSLIDNYAISSSTLMLNKWTHLVHTYSDEKCKVYLNGTLTATESCYKPRSYTRSDNYVGKSNWGGNGLLNCHLDELRIYNRSLNKSDINQLMDYVPFVLSNTAIASDTTYTDRTLNTTIFTTTSTLTTNSIFKMNYTSFNFAQLDSQRIINLLGSNYDLTGCILNCSNKGICEHDFIDDKFICSCILKHMTGYACQIDTRPCSSNPCLNNGTCIDYSTSENYNISAMVDANSSSFYCLCNDFYKGIYCETKIILCQNETCSGNGYCNDLNNKPICKCFNMFSGDKCETQSNELKTVKAVISTSTVLAILIIISFFSCILLMDITKYYCKPTIKKTSLKPRKK